MWVEISLWLIVDVSFELALHKPAVPVCLVAAVWAFMVIEIVIPFAAGACFLREGFCGWFVICVAGFYDAVAYGGFYYEI